jgi:hypothetical protein
MIGPRQWGSFLVTGPEHITGIEAPYVAHPNDAILALPAQELTGGRELRIERRRTVIQL